VDAPEIYPRLNDIFRDVFEQDDIMLSPMTVAADVDGWDSLAHVRLMISVERAFKLGSRLLPVSDDAQSGPGACSILMSGSCGGCRHHRTTCADVYATYSRNRATSARQWRALATHALNESQLRALASAIFKGWTDRFRLWHLFVRESLATERLISCSPP